MAMKNNLTEAKMRKQKASDAVTYKVAAALLILFLTVISLQKLDDYYNTIGGYDVLHPLTGWFLIGGLAAAAVCAVLLFVLKPSAVRSLMPWGIAIGLMISATTYAMRTSLTDDFPLLYLFGCGMLILYIIFQLYRWEFFLFSAVTFAAGGAFYQFSRGIGLDLSSYITALVPAVIILLSCGCTFLAAGNKGVLKLGNQAWKLFPAKFSPLPIYIAGAFWLICTVAVFSLGSLFAYYCMFAAIAVEFIAAVYYTVQLK